MSNDKIKDDADRRAEAAIKSAKEKCYGPGNWANSLEGDYGTWDDWQNLIANAIRAAVADEREANDRIMTDLLSESEQAQEMWRQGAEAMREKIIRHIYHADTVMPGVARATGVQAAYEDMIECTPIPLPPSQTASGEVLRPSKVMQERERYKKALEKVLYETRIIDMHDGNKVIHCEIIAAKALWRTTMKKGDAQSRANDE